MAEGDSKGENIDRKESTESLGLRAVMFRLDHGQPLKCLFSSILVLDCCALKTNNDLGEGMSVCYCTKPFVASEMVQ